ncbi:hypothetical protein KY312_00110, partial [Candidatus Woesearchaeota archaeon]|nr:hypothetical protein [Candidatus Woesearchaeota archaeon]
EVSHPFVVAPPSPEKVLRQRIKEELERVEAPPNTMPLTQRINAVLKRMSISQSYDFGVRTKIANKFDEYCETGVDEFDELDFLTRKHREDLRRLGDIMTVNYGSYKMSTLQKIDELEKSLNKKNTYFGNALRDYLFGVTDDFPSTEVTLEEMQAIEEVADVVMDDLDEQLEQKQVGNTQEYKASGEDRVKFLVEALKKGWKIKEQPDSYLVFHDNQVEEVDRIDGNKKISILESFVEMRKMERVPPGTFDDSTIDERTQMVEAPNTMPLKQRMNVVRGLGGIIESYGLDWNQKIKSVFDLYVKSGVDVFDQLDFLSKEIKETLRRIGNFQRLNYGSFKSSTMQKIDEVEKSLNNKDEHFVNALRNYIFGVTDQFSSTEITPEEKQAIEEVREVVMDDLDEQLEKETEKEQNRQRNKAAFLDFTLQQAKEGRSVSFGKDGVTIGDLSELLEEDETPVKKKRSWFQAAIAAGVFAVAVGGLLYNFHIRSLSYGVTGAPHTMIPKRGYSDVWGDLHGDQDGLVAGKDHTIVIRHENESGLVSSVFSENSIRDFESRRKPLDVIVLNEKPVQINIFDRNLLENASVFIYMEKEKENQGVIKRIKRDNIESVSGIIEWPDSKNLPKFLYKTSFKVKPTADFEGVCDLVVITTNLDGIISLARMPVTKGGDCNGLYLRDITISPLFSRNTENKKIENISLMVELLKGVEDSAKTFNAELSIPELKYTRICKGRLLDAESITRSFTQIGLNLPEDTPDGVYDVEVRLSHGSRKPNFFKREIAVGHDKDGKMFFLDLYRDSYDYSKKGISSKGMKKIFHVPNAREYHQISDVPFGIHEEPFVFSVNSQKHEIYGTHMKNADKTAVVMLDSKRYELHMNASQNIELDKQQYEIKLTKYKKGHITNSNHFE